MKTFYQALGNSLIITVVNTFAWFAATFWTYLETESVLVTSTMAGIYTVAIAGSGFFLGSIVDHNKKKYAMMLSTGISLALYLIATIVYFLTPESAFANPYSPSLWILLTAILFANLAGNIRGIALSTLVKILVPDGERDKANGLIGTVFGLSFLVASIFSGFAVGMLGMQGVILITLFVTLAGLIHLNFLKIEEKGIVHTEDQPQKIDIKGTFKIVKQIPGLMWLILFHCFNNFLGGVFMALMDAYGLSLVSVEIWGLLWGFLSTGFIVGGMIIAKRGLGKNPVKTMFVLNIILWCVSSVFTLQASIILLSIGMYVYMVLMPAVEAAEQTILQKVIPQDRLGRVIGFAQSIEQSASPITAFLVGPIAQFITIPFMTTGAGVQIFGPIIGVGADRGIALIFTGAAIIGLIATILGMKTKAYKLISNYYIEAK